MNRTKSLALHALLATVAAAFMVPSAAAQCAPGGTGTCTNPALNATSGAGGSGGSGAPSGTATGGSGLAGDGGDGEGGAGGSGGGTGGSGGGGGSAGGSGQYSGATMDDDPGLPKGSGPARPAPIRLAGSATTTGKAPAATSPGRTDNESFSGSNFVGGGGSSATGGNAGGSVGILPFNIGV